jgi:uncharacterized membrane protein
MRNLRPFRDPPKFDVAALALSLPLLLMGSAVLFGGWTSLPKALSQFRNPLLVSALWIAPFWLLARARIVQRIDPAGLRRLALALYGLAFVKAAVLDYLSFHVHALDASIYDYALMNTLRGRFMESITGIDHFAIHATPVLFLLAPLHVLFHSPLFSVIAQAVGLFVGALLFDRCLKARDTAPWPRFGLVFAYLNSIWLSRTLHYGFHVEIFYPIAIFVCDLAVHRRGRSVLFYSGAFAFLLSIKEDAPFHASALVIAYALMGKVSRMRAISTVAISAAVLVFYLKFLIPGHAPSGAYEFAASASSLGKDPATALHFLLENPFYVVKRFFTGGWWSTLVPCLGLLGASPFFWIAAAPILGIYSLVGDAQMFYVTIYYGVPILGALALGLAEGYRRVENLRLGGIALLLAIAGLSLSGSGYLVFRKMDFQFWRAIRSELSLVPTGARVCAPGIFVPQLPYGEVRLLDEACLADADYAILLEPESTLLRFPLSTEEESRIKARVNGWKRLDSDDRNASNQLQIRARN